MARSSEMRFCVYKHLVNGEVFYVGQGLAPRPFERAKRNQKWTSLAEQNKGKVLIEIVSWHDTLPEARAAERILIRKLKPACNIQNNRGDYNIFADLGLPNADMHMVKAQIVLLIGKMIDELGITQQAAAVRMGFAQSDVSNLLRGCFDGFSLKRLFGFLRAFGCDIEIKVKRRRDHEHEGRLSLMTA
jgi:predicted XRE-type DNA-binding protein